MPHLRGESDGRAARRGRVPGLKCAVRWNGSSLPAGTRPIRWADSKTPTQLLPPLAPSLPPCHSPGRAPRHPAGHDLRAPGRRAESRARCPAAGQKGRSGGSTARAECTAEHVNLLESLIGKLAHRLMRLPGVLGVRVRIAKLEIFTDCEVAIRVETGLW